MKKIKNKIKGFTLIELLVVISILGLLASVMLVAFNDVREKAKRSIALTNQRQLSKAVELYFDDVGFYPPDTNRGWDPGIAKPLPYNKDLGYDCNVDPTPCTCPSAIFPPCGATPFPLPANWMTQVTSRWKGPYIAIWPNTAPWNGKYDYNNWTVVTNRYGCNVPAGIYIGTQKDYSDGSPMPLASEQWFLANGMDADNCINGESQLTLVKY